MIIKPRLTYIQKFTPLRFAAGGTIGILLASHFTGRGMNDSWWGLITGEWVLALYLTVIDRKVPDPEGNS